MYACTSAGPAECVCNHLTWTSMVWTAFRLGTCPAATVQRAPSLPTPSVPRHTQHTSPPSCTMCIAHSRDPVPPAPRGPQNTSPPTPSAQYDPTTKPPRLPPPPTYAPAAALCPLRYLGTGAELEDLIGEAPEGLDARTLSAAAGASAASDDEGDASGVTSDDSGGSAWLNDDIDGPEATCASVLGARCRSPLVVKTEGAGGGGDGGSSCSPEVRVGA